MKAYRVQLWVSYKGPIYSSAGPIVILETIADGDEDRLAVDSPEKAARAAVKLASEKDDRGNYLADVGNVETIDVVG